MKQETMKNKNSINDLPPSKRFKFLGHQRNKTPSPKPLPAKKRLNSYQKNHDSVHQRSSSVYLPAKKRIWAPCPFSFSPIKLSPQPQEKQRRNDVCGKSEDEGKKRQQNEVCYKSKEEGEKLQRKEVCCKSKDEIHKRQQNEICYESKDEDEDDGIICDVCQSTDGDTIDPIVFCDGCDLMVHATCYGNPLAVSIPEGDWFCERCLNHMDGNHKADKKDCQCCLCPAKGGALKMTTDGQWAHIACALLVPEVFFKGPEGRDGIDCSQIPEYRWKKGCYLCKKRGIGCVIECSEMRCGLGFHVSCGLEQKFCFEYKEGRNGTVIASFCEEHTEMWKEQQLTGKFKIVAREQKGKN